MRPVRLILILDLIAAAAAGLALVLGLGLPLAAGGNLTPGLLAAVAVAAAAVFVVVGGVLLRRAVANPVERLLSSAERLGAGDAALPILGPPDDQRLGALSRTAVAFERLATAFVEERARLVEKIGELERANRELAETRESLLRSERLAAVGRLASGVAHEVGNPLGAVAGYAELALGRIRAGATPEALDLVGRIGEEAGRIDRIVRELLDFARPIPITVAPFPIGAAIESALRLARVQPRFRDVRVERDVPADLPTVTADEGRVAQVFLNLFLNAGDAMAGAGSVRVAARPASGMLEVTVSDEGPGIPADDLPRVFDPFFTTKAPGVGTGLGLSVSHRIMESMRGSISAGNAASGGAVFRMTLPTAGDR